MLRRFLSRSFVRPCGSTREPGRATFARIGPVCTLIRIVPLCALALVGAASPARAQVAPLSAQVEIRRTHYGVPHILADNLRAFGYGMGWVQLEDYAHTVTHMLLRNRGQLGLTFGADSIDSDFTNRRLWLRAVEVYPLLSPDARAVYEGFAAALNDYVRTHPGEFPDWVRPDFSGPDVLTSDMEWPNPAFLRRTLQRLGVPPSNFDVGSNAWALAPSRTKSGKAILLRNPHLDWDAGYYEAHVTVPGVLNFYGDYRIGGPFQTIGGFNERLGWSTTNNAPDPDEIYVLAEDPAQPDHYRFDGASIPLRRVAATIPYRSGDSIAYATRESWETHLGRVIHRADGKIYVWKVAGFEQFRLAEQWLAMMKARNLEQWQEAMRMLEKPSSNFTYADADGHIFYAWFGHQPRLPHASGGDTAAVPAATSDDVWTHLFPFDSLPRLLDPKGGYIHQENDSFHYTNLNEVIPRERFPDNFPAPSLGLRSQHGLALIGGREKFSLEDVVRLKHSYRALAADRTKAELIAAARPTASPAMDSVLDLLSRWDNTVAPESRGSVVFEAFWARYLQTAQAPPGVDRNALIWREPWSPAEPTATPRGLADPARAVAALEWAVADVVRRFGRWDVAFGEVHRVRLGAVDEPVGGCGGNMGCFRVLAYSEDPDGKLRATSGDGWVLAVEFGAVPRAYSVLAYGNSNRADSPHHSDQAAMFARGQLKPVAFTEADIARATIRRYRPGPGD
jgi:acyl-homoserine-lactone acylase